MMGEEHSISIRNEKQEILESKCISQLLYEGGPFSLRNWSLRDDSNGRYVWKEKETGDSYSVWNQGTVDAIEKALNLYFPFTIEESIAFEETRDVLEWIKSKQEKYKDENTHVVFETYYGY